MLGLFVDQNRRRVIESSTNEVRSLAEEHRQIIFLIKVTLFQLFIEIAFAEILKKTDPKELLECET